AACKTGTRPRPRGSAPRASCAAPSAAAPEQRALARARRAAHRGRNTFRKRWARMDRDYELQTHRAEDRHWWYRGRRRVIERVVEGLRLPSRVRILDAGCGSGRNMVELARHGPVTGVELSDTSAHLARARETGEVISGSVLEM